MLVLGALANASPIKRDDNSKEVVYLAECNKYDSSNNWSAAMDRLYYFSDENKLDAAMDSTKPDYSGIPSDPTNHDGFLYHIDWTLGTYDDPITTSINNDDFKFWGLSKVPTGNLTGQATYKGVDFACYRADTSAKMDLDDDYKCTPQYLCTHEDQWIRRTLVNIRSDSTDVTVEGVDKSELSLVKPADAFQHLLDSINNNAGPQTTYDLGGDCTIAFDYEFGDIVGDINYNSKTPSMLTELLVKKAAPVVADTMKDWETYSFNWGIPKYHKTLTYPSNGRIVIQAGQRANWNPVTQSYVEFTVSCKNACGNSNKRLAGEVASELALASALFDSVDIVDVFGAAPALIGVVNGLFC